MIKLKDILVEMYLKESGYEEAWELLLQDIPEIKRFVNQHKWKADDELAKKLGVIIDSIKNETLQPSVIPKLKNLTNRKGEEKILADLQKISGQKNAKNEYIRLMALRDEHDNNRKRGYNVSDLINNVEAGKYEPPVILKLDSGDYVIGGRTRFYAALALNKPINVKYITNDTFKQNFK